MAVTRFLSEVGGLITGLILFMGVSLVNLLSGEEAYLYIGEGTSEFFKKWKLWMYGGFALLFAFQQISLRWPKPVSMFEVEDMKVISNQLLGNAITDYYEEIKKLGGNPILPSARVNLMLPTWRRFRIGQYLKIYYSNGGPAGVSYPGAELDLKWTRNNATCGAAWAKERTVIYDSNTQGLKSPEGSLTTEQKEVVGDIKSVLSVPVWSKAHKKVVGVLNLDSKWNIDRTFFDRTEVVQLLEAQARLFSMMLFPDGIKPN